MHVFGKAMKKAQISYSRVLHGALQALDLGETRLFPSERLCWPLTSLTSKCTA
jgi:hypothetical protein